MELNEAFLLFFLMTEDNGDRGKLTSQPGKWSGILPEWYLLFGEDNMKLLVDYYGGKTIDIPSMEDIRYVLQRIVFYYKTEILGEEPRKVTDELGICPANINHVKRLCDLRKLEMLEAKRDLSSISEDSKWKKLQSILSILKEKDSSLDARNIFSQLETVLKNIKGGRKSWEKKND